MLSLLISPLLLNDAFYRRIWMLLATHPKENEMATFSPLTMARARHHGPTVVLAGIGFLLFPCSMGVTSHGGPWGRSKYIQ